jgi:hypothetical protein
MSVASQWGKRTPAPSISPEQRDTRGLAKDTRTSMRDTRIKVCDTRTSMGDTRIKVCDTRTSMGDTRTKVCDIRTSMGDTRRLPSDPHRHSRNIRTKQIDFRSKSRKIRTGTSGASFVMCVDFMVEGRGSERTTGRGIRLQRRSMTLAGMSLGGARGSTAMRFF